MVWGLLAKGAGLLGKGLGLDIIKNVGGMLGGWVENKRKLSAAKQDTEMKIELSKQEVIGKQATADIDKNLLWVKQAETSWKDELWTVIFAAMFVSAFFAPERLEDGLTVLGNMDSDMKILMGIVIGAAFGAAEVRKTFGKK